MILLRDTHALLWARAASRQLSAAAREAIVDPDNEIRVSSVSAREIAIKRTIGRLHAPSDLTGAVASAGFTERPITLADVARLESLPSHHCDPFDRMLVAQALVDGIPIVSRDVQLERDPVQILW